MYKEKEVSSLFWITGQRMEWRVEELRRERRMDIQAREAKSKKAKKCESGEGEQEGEKRKEV